MPLRSLWRPRKRTCAVVTGRQYLWYRKRTTQECRSLCTVRTACYGFMYRDTAPDDHALGDCAMLLSSSGFVNTAHWVFSVICFLKLHGL